MTPVEQTRNLHYWFKSRYKSNLSLGWGKFTQSSKLATVLACLHCQSATESQCQKKKKKTTRLGKSYIDVFASSMKDKIPSRMAPEAKAKVFQNFL
jgi:hypothetical protein